MMHITEDTPPDMLAGAMDLTVHLPSGRTVKMSVERSTPMMDLLVQITTTQNLQLSNFILQALDMASPAEIGDKILPYKPNTPIGALDTQHIKVVPKSKPITVPKNVPPGHQPFESTFRLKVHLPRNQLYVTRVSQNVHLEEIMSKVCVEKVLDPAKYELRHPGNLDELLDPKLTLSDYQITEIYVVGKNSGRLSQTFSASDIMALRKQEERKQFQAKTGGGVFNLIFKRGKSSQTNGSVSSNENRSVSPNEDRRSVTPPVVQPNVKDLGQDRPKPPQRKRRPAPKPPQLADEAKHVEKPSSQISNNSNQSDSSSKKGENGLIICHSRNSSDSSGYHEASILSDNCNTSLPRRPKTMYDDRVDAKMLNGEHSKSTSNLIKMSSQSKSSTSLIVPGRRKKTAPPPPPVRRTEDNVENASPIVASQPIETIPAPKALDRSLSTNAPTPAPRRNKLSTTRSSSIVIEDNPNITDSFKIDLNAKLMKRLPLIRRSTESQSTLRPRSEIEDSSSVESLRLQQNSQDQELVESVAEIGDISKAKLDQNFSIEEVEEIVQNIELEEEESVQYHTPYNESDEEVNYSSNFEEINEQHKLILPDEVSCSNSNEIYDANEAKNEVITSSMNQEIKGTTLDESTDFQTLDKSENFSIEVITDDQDVRSVESKSKDDESYSGESIKKSISMDSLRSDFSMASTNSKGSKPEIVAVIPKKRKSTNFDTLSRKRGFQIGTSLLNIDAEDDAGSLTTTSDDNTLSDYPSISSKMSDADQSNDFELDFNEEMFQKSASRRQEKRFKEKKRNELNGIHPLDEDVKQIGKIRSNSSLRSMDNIPGFMGVGNIKKWNNVQDLDDISNVSAGSLRARSRNWIVGDFSDTESISTVPTNSNSPPQSPSIQAQSIITSSNSSARNSVSNLIIPAVTSKEIVDSKIELKEAAQESREEIKKVDLDSKNEVDSGICENTLSDSAEKDEIELETDWQYQLPSPPKGFRDASPSITTASSNCDTETIPDSVVTSPELFEKLKHVQDVRSIASDLPSVVSEVEEKEMCNKLTLEHLEKRKTLVYNRELATSLKYAQEDNVSEKKRSSVINELENVISNNKGSSTLLRTNSKPVENVKSSTLPNRNLPNFQISTYGGTKEKVNIFEDDTVRSNEISNNKINLDKNDTPPFVNVEHFNTAENKNEDIFKKPEISNYKPQKNFITRNFNVNRSESFSNNIEWSPSNPVKRSKSQVALNRFKDNNLSKNDDPLSKSNSLLDVSNLQSLEVMKKIQTQLSNSKDELDKGSKLEERSEQKTPVPQTTSSSVKTYQNRGPPSINVGTWSQRPKTEVTLKADEDYKLGTGTIGAKLRPIGLVNLKSATSFSGVKQPTSILSSSGDVKQSQNGVSIKINGTEPIVQQKSGNVVIRIGGNDQKEPERVTNHFQNDIIRKPLGNINKIERARPHSIAFDIQSQTNYAPPVVRSVELKKQFQDLQSKSITHISNNNNFDQPKSLNYANSFNYNSELKSDNKNTALHSSNESLSKPSFRSNNLTPVVKGFGSNLNKNLKTWSTYGTLPVKNEGNSEIRDLNTNRNVPFSQSNLRRTESSKVLSNVSNNISSNNNASNTSNIFGNVVLRNNSNSFKSVRDKDEKMFIPPPPVAPPAPKLSKPKVIQPEVDNRDQLLQQIRNFGGRKGLKASKI